MAITGKDINQLAQKATVDGTEKLPVSDTQYITPDQIAGLKLPSLSSSDTNKLLGVDSNGNIIASFSFGTTGTDYFLSRIYTWLLEGNEYSDYSFIKPGDVNTTLQDALDAKQNKITVSSSEPTSSQGNNGDIWIVI